jgi:hypothetical protein
MGEQKGFVIYGDVRAVVDELTDEQTGKLFKAMIAYFTTGKAPKFDGVLKYVWIPIRQQMDRDKEKYDAKCEKNRAKIQKYWDEVKANTNEYSGIQTYTNATNTNTNTNTKTNTDTDTTTNTDTDTKAVGGGGSYDVDDEFNIWKRLTPEDIDVLYEKFPNSGGLLIDEVYADVKAKKKKVRSGLNYILGYAKKVGWDDNADHFSAPWEAM